MPMIKAFQGWRYNPLKIAEVADVLAPPYDVISRVEQEALHKRSPYNVIRLILGKEEAGDDAADNKYARAGRALRAWMSSGILVKKKPPAVYVYVQNYKEGQKPKTRLGFMAAMKIDEKAVLKHENTLASPKKDRLALLKKVSTNLSPIFGLIEDKKGGVGLLQKPGHPPLFRPVRGKKRGGGPASKSGPPRLFRPDRGQKRRGGPDFEAGPEAPRGG